MRQLTTPSMRQLDSVWSFFMRIKAAAGKLRAWRAETANSTASRHIAFCPHTPLNRHAYTPFIIRFDGTTEQIQWIRTALEEQTLH